MKQFIAIATERWPWLNRKEREYAAMLLRRIDHLREVEEEGTANDWDRAEAAALAWALKQVKP